eukprot:COSAG02_NODE_1133_length_14390_cov_3.493178_9_plen_86_part_00
MQHNKLDGNLPAELAFMDTMKHLKLGANDLRGEMFELDRMTNLRCVRSFDGFTFVPFSAQSWSSTDSSGQWAGSCIGLSHWNTTA